MHYPAFGTVFKHPFSLSCAKDLVSLPTSSNNWIRVLEVSQVERYIPYVGQRPGRPPEDRCAIARAFVAKAVYNLPTTEVLLDQLKSDIRLRRLCGWERQQEIPSRATFSRTFTKFAET